MTRRFIHLSNHPVAGWGESQLAAALEYGEVSDIPFPMIDPGADTDTVSALAGRYADMICPPGEDGLGITVHLMGEMTFTARLCTLLQHRGVDVVASTTERHVVENPENGTRTSTFRFVRFRRYPRL